MPTDINGHSVVAAFVGFFFIAITEATRFVVFWLSTYIERRLGLKARVIIIISITGALNGLLLCIYPLCAGSGSDMIRPTLENAPALSAWTLVGACVAKCATFAVGSAGGFVGGMFFPLMYVGVLAGEACAQIMGTPRNLTDFVMMAAVPGSLISAPLSFVALPIGMFIMSPLQTVPIFLGVVISNKLLLGTGLLHMLLRAELRHDGT